MFVTWRYATLELTQWQDCCVTIRFDFLLSFGQLNVSLKTTRESFLINYRAGSAGISGERDINTISQIDIKLGWFVVYFDVALAPLLRNHTDLRRRVSRHVQVHIKPNTRTICEITTVLLRFTIKLLVVRVTRIIAQKIMWHAVNIKTNCIFVKSNVRWDTLIIDCQFIVPIKSVRQVIANITVNKWALNIRLKKIRHHSNHC